MQQLFNTLGYAVEGAPLVAVGAAVIWGILSIVLSPCHLASLPLIVGFIDNQGRMSARRAFLISSVFALGILITIAFLGVVTAAAGRIMGDIGSYGNYIVAALFFLVGLHLLEVIPMPFSGPGQVGMKRKGILAAFILGLVFGILGPCTLPTWPHARRHLPPASNPAYAVLLLFAYGIGHCSVIVAAGTSTELVRFLNWNEQSRNPGEVVAVCWSFLADCG